jgi:hypothetical protein
MNNRAADSKALSEVSRQALFGDKCLRPKVLRLRAIHEELEALNQTRSQVATRLSKNTKGAAINVPAALEAGVGSGSLCLSEWVLRLLSHEDALKGVSARSVKEACNGVLGSTNQLVELRDVKAHYPEILAAVDKLTQERMTTVRSELDKLDSEVGEIEELIVLCYEKMDEDDNGWIARERFVEFVCGEGDEDSGSTAVSSKDAECLFNQMSKGEETLTFERFKDEITNGCLQTLRGNIDLRRSMLKRYRDYWF